MRWRTCTMSAASRSFLFQDDDFPLYGKVWQRWTRDLIREPHRAGLVGRVI